MKQVVRRVIDRRGRILVAEVPAPHPRPQEVLIRTRYTLISSGTELSTLRKTPLELVRQTLSDPWMREAVTQSLKSGGLARTAGRVIDELKLYRILGYSGAGEVVAAGAKAPGFRPGDRVAFAARGHAEMVAASRHHTVPIPEGVPLREAAFLTVGGIAIQGVRRAQVELGHHVAVIGLGLVGQLVAQAARAAGARVIGIDPHPGRLALARELGMEHGVSPTESDPVRAVRALTGGHGADRVIICAASRDRSIANGAMKMARLQGRVVAVGIVRMDLERMPFFRGELEFAFSRAYGPGSYDPGYESGAVDYPYGYVRWTEERNLAEFLRLLAAGAVKVAPLIDREHPVEEAQEAFDRIRTGAAENVASLLAFDSACGEPSGGSSAADVVRIEPRRAPRPGRVRVGVIGCGNFTRGIRLPDLAASSRAELRALASATGVAAAAEAARYRPAYCTTDRRRILDDPEVDAVLISTRHDLHAPLALEALRSGKAVFVEKPLAMSLEELDAVREAAVSSGLPLQVGHNRRFAPALRAVQGLLPRAPKVIEYHVAVSPIPADHWTLDPVEGGGRLLGEATHFLDVMNALSGSRPATISAAAPPTGGDPALATTFQVTVSYAGGDLGLLVYSALGGPRSPRELIRVHCAGETLELGDFRVLRRNGRRKLLAGRSLGHREEMEAFLRLLAPRQGGTDPAAEIAARLREADDATRAALLARQSLRDGRAFAVEAAPAPLQATCSS